MKPIAVPGFVMLERARSVEVTEIYAMRFHAAKGLNVSAESVQIAHVYLVLISERIALKKAIAVSKMRYVKMYAVLILGNLVKPLRVVAIVPTHYVNRTNVARTLVNLSIALDMTHLIAVLVPGSQKARQQCVVFQMAKFLIVINYVVQFG